MTQNSGHLTIHLTILYPPHQAYILHWIPAPFFSKVYDELCALKVPGNTHTVNEVNRKELLETWLLFW